MPPPAVVLMPFCSCSSLLFVIPTSSILRDNELSGTIPPEIGNCEQLQTMYVEACALYLARAYHACRLTVCTAYCEICVPLCNDHPLAHMPFCSCSSLLFLTLTSSYLYGNELSGEIPKEIGSCVKLKTLYVEAIVRFTLLVHMPFNDVHCLQ